MSLCDYRVSREIEAQDYPFYAIIMAAMRKADSHNYDALRKAFPATSMELNARYNAPGGLLDGEK